MRGGVATLLGWLGYLLRCARYSLVGYAWPGERMECDAYGDCRSDDYHDDDDDDDD